MPLFANNGSLFLMAVTKAIIAIIIVGSMAYCLIMQIPIPDVIEKVIYLVIGAYFGLSAKVYHESQRNEKLLKRQIWEHIGEKNKDARE